VMCLFVCWKNKPRELALLCRESVRSWIQRMDDRSQGKLKSATEVCVYLEKKG
jgi:hypothetical protein